MPAQAIPLAIAAAFFPTGLIIFTLLVAYEPFVGRAIAFLIGAYLMTFICGVLFLTVAHGTDAAGGSGQRSVSGWVDIGLGVLLLAAALIARRRGPSEKADKEQPAWMQRLMHSPALAFVLGAAMYAPSPLYLGSLKTLADAGLSTSGNIAWVAFLSVIVTSMISIPVVLMLKEPESGRRILANVNAWLSRNGRNVVVVALFLGGIYLLVRGITRVA